MTDLYTYYYGSDSTEYTNGPSGFDDKYVKGITNNTGYWKLYCDDGFGEFSRIQYLWVAYYTQGYTLFTRVYDTSSIWHSWKKIFSTLD